MESVSEFLDISLLAGFVCSSGRCMNLLQRVIVKMKMTLHVNLRGQDNGRRFLNLSCYYGSTWFSQRKQLLWLRGGGGRCAQGPVDAGEGCVCVCVYVCVCVCVCVCV